MTALPSFRQAVVKVLIVVITVTGPFSIFVEPSHKAQAQTYDVCATGCTYQSIQPAINAASAGSTIRIGPGTYQEHITLRPGVSLYGAGAAQTILRSNGAFPVILAEGGAIGRATVVEQLAVTNGGGAFGAGIFARQNAMPTIRNVAIYGNRATQIGGGVSAMEGADVLLQAVQIHDNTASHGGGLGIFGGRATVSSSTIENNSAVDSGGAIVAFNQSILTMNGVVVTNNHAGQGGGLWNDHASVTVTNCQFLGNQAQVWGGAIGAFTGAQLLVDSSYFANNQAFDLTGGAILINQTGGEIRNSVFDGNSARNVGGAIHLYTASNPLVVGNTIANNHAIDGAGIYVQGGQARIIQNTIRDNQATSFGGGVVINNQAYVELGKNRIEHNRANIDGGGVVIQEASSGVIESNSISFNHAGEVGGGMKIYDRATPLLRNNRFVGNLAERDGGAIQIEEGAAPIIENSEFVDNNANLYGGAIVLNINAVVTIRYGTFIGNHAGVSGGAIIVVSGSRVQIEKSSISHNHAGSVGGGLLIMDDNNSLITDSIISHNEAGSHGAGVYLDNTLTRLNGNQIVANVAQDIGGGLVILDSSPTVTNNLVARNRSGNVGDGVYLSNSNATISNNTVSDNDQAGGGHGIYVTTGARPVVTYNLVQKNGIGIGGTSQPAQMMRNCFWSNSLGNYVGIAQGASDFSVNPQLTNGLLGPYYLSQIPSGQPSTSPLVDAGGQTAQAAGLANMTTRTDQQPDQGQADIGYHYGRVSVRPAQYLPMVPRSN